MSGNTRKTLFSLGHLPDGFESFVRALNKLARRATGGVPTFRNNTALKTLFKRHISGPGAGRRGAADAATRFLLNVAVALKSEEFGILVDVDRAQLVLDQSKNTRPWVPLEGDKLDEHVQALEQRIHDAQAERGPDPDPDPGSDSNPDSNPDPDPNPTLNLEAMARGFEAVRAEFEASQALEAQLQELQVELGQKQRHFDGLADALSEAETALTRARERFEDAQGEVAAAQSLHERRVRAVEEARRRLDAAQAESNSSARALSQAQEQEASASESLKSAESRKNALDQLSETAILELDEARGLVEEARGQRDEDRNSERAAQRRQFLLLAAELGVIDP